MNVDQNDTTEENTEEQESPVLAIARQYFMELAGKSDELRTEMTGARTKTKRDYFLKKLRKNNKDAIDLLSKLSNFEQNKALMQAAKATEENAADEHG